MRRGRNSGLKKVLLIYGGTVLVLVIACVIVYSVYNNKLRQAAQDSLLAAEKLTDLVPNNLVAEAGAEISKTIEEALQENDENALGETIESNTEQNIKENASTIEEDVAQVENEQSTVTSTNPETAPGQEASAITEPVVEEPVKKELKFEYPVEGEIVKAYSVDNLVFSETLQEWVVHKGIDIKAARTTVVKAAEEGTVTAIKNDPRYGLTVIVEHIDGYKTIYSNLLTTEFVTEGEAVTKGQSLGTVGNSASFEIADEPHLHFEMLKDEENVDPTLFLK